ncbi:hypothetical protein [Fluviibacter phosphoraccumulans]|uniref:Uncharacterized protein n=1 Tax=Fluviibacter phosphoraccumulans TaxID=1751046 RepID=A0A7R6R667_9RHOO|nr:hypothetical protein [Fluviibacter phosphoraccumulans]BBU68674.1 hypothetical protein ICHIAU1_09570 [Fluviibacter phosphoraccumulans]BBU72171.1 hypothetical protein ICHIJ1_20900 [Fluviibacter phosphoraccumulans]
MPDEIMQNTDQSRFEHFLPFYVTNKLSEEDKAFVNAYAAANSDAKKAIQFTEKLRHIIRNTGAHRNPDVALGRLLADYKTRERMSIIKRLLAKLRSLGISPPLAIALVIIIGQGIGYVAHEIYSNARSQSNLTSPAPSQLSITIKNGTELGTVAVIVEQFGGRIVHSTTTNSLEKLFISIMDKTKIQALIDALMDAGLIETAAILL